MSRMSDAALAMAASIVDDLERVRIANSNRIRQLVRPFGELDEDGQYRGFGLDPEHEDVLRLQVLVDELVKAENMAVRDLEKKMKAHPLGPWIENARGIGLKQGARLLAAIGDPYWHDVENRPRLVAELWSYSGFGDSLAQVRRRGQVANWSDDARKRAWLVAVSILKSGGPYREIYDRAREKYADAVHETPCVRCGPSGKPAMPGTPLSAGHQHGRGLRAIAKAVLKDLWIESKRLHEEAQQRSAA